MYECFLFSMLICTEPEMPVRSPVPESGITVIESDGAPRFIVAECCRRNVPAASMQTAGDLLDRDVSSRALHRRHRRKHFALARTFEIARELFVEGHAAEGRRVACPGDVERKELDLERSGCALGHVVIRCEGSSSARRSTQCVEEESNLN